MFFFTLQSRDKKFNSLKKSASRKQTKDEPSEGNHVASLDRKYLKFLSSAGKQNCVPVPTAQFRSYRRVPPMEKPPQTASESSQSTDLKYVVFLKLLLVPNSKVERGIQELIFCTRRKLKIDFFKFIMTIRYS